MRVVGKGTLRVELYRGEELIESSESEHDIVSDGFNTTITFENPINVGSGETLRIQFAAKGNL